ncbi:MAG: glycoside hydrolase family 13 protein [Eubacteriales bacterium]|nr:glycoside hydrolase family 13 protein [Eubacteriales bacterium]
MTKQWTYKGIDKEALFSDGTEDYCFPTECDPGDRVRIRFRTLKNNVDRVAFIRADENSETLETMKKAFSDTYFDYYETELRVGRVPVHYYFEAERGEESCIYTRLGADGGLGHRSYFVLMPGFHVPEWLKGCVMYQIFTDRFCNGDSSNDVRTGEYTYLKGSSEQVTDWNAPVSTLDVGRFYGGDLGGVLEKLPYLKSLGIEAIYFNPLFVSPSNHKYDCQDYEHIDPHLTVIKEDGDYVKRTADPVNLEASDAFFAGFIARCHEEGIKVIIDGVFNHCGSYNRMMDRGGIYRRAGGYEPGAYETADSPYRYYFKFADERPEAWPENGSYEKWWDNDTLPKLNYEGPSKLWDYILSIGRKWIAEPYNADGWRLDVAADLGHSPECNHSFWRDFRKAVREVKPEAIVLAEHYGDAYPWLQGGEWDTVMNYDAFMEPVSYFLTGMEKHSDSYRGDLEGDGQAFFDAMRHGQCAMQTSSILGAMNELSNHDHSRFLTRTNKRPGRLETAGAEAASENINIGLFSAAVVIQMTWPGAPTVYYGDEAGLCGWTDPDDRRPYPWGRENHQLLDFHTYMIKLHKHDVFRKGAWKELYAGRYLIAYGRMLGKHISFTVVNAGDCTQELELPVWLLGITDDMTITRVVHTDHTRYNVGLHHRASRNGSLHCTMPPYSAKVYINWAADEYNISWVDV